MPTLYDNFSQIRQYIDENAGQADLSAYVTKTELANCGYVTSTALENASYATTTYVADYVAEHGGGSTVIDENIIPKENNTYTLGDSSYLYNATYTGSLYLHPNNGWINVSNWQTKFRIDNSDKYYLTSNRFYPNINGACHLGSNSNKWGDTYTNNIYADNAYTSNLYLNNNNVLYNKTQYQVNLKLNGGDKYVFRTNHLSPASDGGSDLGQSDLHWNNAYINNAYITNYNNLIWTGTSAEYEALSDYTTYQLYLVKDE